MPNVTFAASANATPASGTVVATHTISSAEHQVMHLGDAAGSILGTSSSPLHTALVGTPTVVQGASGACPWGVRLVDAAGSAYGFGAASPIFVSACITNLAGSAAGSPLYAVQTNATGSATGSPTFVSVTNIASVIVSSGSVVVTNGLSASISNTVTVAQGASGACPWGVRILDAGGSGYGVGTGSPLYVSASITNLAGSAAGSPLYTVATNTTGSAAGSPTFSSITNLAGSAAGSPLYTVQTNATGSAAGSPTFTSITNQGGSAAGSPVYTSACITNLAGSAAGSPLFFQLTDKTGVYGGAGSPISMTGQATKIYWSGSLLTLQQVNISSSISGCTTMIASLTGFSIIVVAATYTTSSCQFIGWAACGNNGGASATIQTAMPFGTNGGMDSNRMPHGYLWQFPSGSKAAMTTTSACNVAGTLNYIQVAS